MISLLIIFIVVFIFIMINVLNEICLRLCACFDWGPSRVRGATNKTLK